MLLYAGADILHVTHSGRNLLHFVLSLVNETHTQQQHHARHSVSPAAIKSEKLEDGGGVSGGACVCCSFSVKDSIYYNFRFVCVCVCVLLHSVQI